VCSSDLKVDVQNTETDKKEQFAWLMYGSELSRYKKTLYPKDQPKWGTDGFNPVIHDSSITNRNLSYNNDDIVTVGVNAANHIKNLEKNNPEKTEEIELWKDYADELMQYMLTH
jgi:hypothetical protein